MTADRTVHGRTSPIPPQGEWRLVFQQHGEPNPGEWIETTHPAVIYAVGLAHDCERGGCQLENPRRLAETRERPAEPTELKPLLTMTADEFAACRVADKDVNATGNRMAAILRELHAQRSQPTPSSPALTALVEKWRQKSKADRDFTANPANDADFSDTADERDVCADELEAALRELPSERERR